MVLAVISNMNKEFASTNIQTKTGINVISETTRQCI